MLGLVMMGRYPCRMIGKLRRMFLAKDKMGMKGPSSLPDNPSSSLFDDFEFKETAEDTYSPPPVSGKVQKRIEKLEETIEQIHEGQFPNWPLFFKEALALDDLYFGSHGQSSSLADELMSVYELAEYDELYSDAQFLDEIILASTDDIHFICFLLTSGHGNLIVNNFLSKMLKVVSEMDSPDDCYGCGMNRWWGNPLAYLAVNENISASNIKKIYSLANKISEGHSRDIVLCALASNVNTPQDILSKLYNEDRESIMAKDEQCPFYDEGLPETANISFWARKHLSERT